MTMMTATVAYAADLEPRDTRTTEGNAITTEEAYELAVDSNEWENWPEGPKTYGEADIIMDADTGAILYAKNIDGKAYPASITKVLTMLIALENGNLEDKVSFSAESVNGVPLGYAHIGMKVGEEISLKDALYGMMLASANEVAYSIGESVGKNAGKDYNWFIQKMNERAKELGAVNSNFLNTNGLDNEEHYTTARDMALITKELLKHPEFEEICQTLQYSIAETNMQSESRVFQQNHKMLYHSHEYYDERVIAGKTGYTDSAKNTLITCTDDGTMRFICVALKTHGTNVYADTSALINYAYDNFEKITLSPQDVSDDIESFTDEKSVTVPKGVRLEDLKMTLVEDEKDHTVGTAVYEYNGRIVGELSVTFSQKYLKNHNYDTDQEVKNKDTEPIKENKVIYKYVLYGLYAIIAIIVVLFIVLIILIQMQQKRARERRRRKKAAARRRKMQNKRR